tara:strand:+ start:7773 stop:8483 length:711 start_codon:yes stop_codon:yes gene_type:complete
MDPITIGAAVSAASSAFKLLKQGFAIGRDIEQMSGDLSRWMSAVSDVDHIEKSAKNPSLFLKMTKGKSVESLALQAFTAKKKLEEQRYELKQYISLTMGRSAWQELIRMEGQIRKQRQEAIYAARQRRQKIIEYIGWTVVGGAGIAVLTALVLLLKTHAANASPLAQSYTTCRLVLCESSGNERICIYRGQNNTQELMTFRQGEWFPREYQCQYKPNAKRPPTIKETLESIRDAMK